MFGAFVGCLTIHVGVDAALVGRSTSRAIEGGAGYVCCVNRWPIERRVLNTNRGVVGCHVRATMRRLSFGRCRQVE
jgi:hypothetical protein